MPTVHRIACLRDDVCFLIYIYQWYLYPVDKARVNEFGRAYAGGPENAPLVEHPGAGGPQEESTEAGAPGS